MYKKNFILFVFFIININIVFSNFNSGRSKKLKELEKKSFLVIFKNKRLKVEKNKDGSSFVGILEDGTEVTIVCSKDINISTSNYIGSFRKIKRKKGKKEVSELTCHVFKKED